MTATIKLLLAVAAVSLTPILAIPVYGNQGQWGNSNVDPNFNPANWNQGVSAVDPGFNPANWNGGAGGSIDPGFNPGNWNNGGSNPPNSAVIINPSYNPNQWGGNSYPTGSLAGNVDPNRYPGCSNCGVQGRPGASGYGY